MPRPHTRRFCNYLVLSPPRTENATAKKKRVPRFRVSLEAPLRARSRTWKTGTQSAGLHKRQSSLALPHLLTLNGKFCGFSSGREMCKRTFVGRDIRKGLAPKPRSFLFALPPPSSFGFMRWTSHCGKTGELYHISRDAEAKNLRFMIYDFRLHLRICRSDGALVVVRCAGMD